MDRVLKKNLIFDLFIHNIKASGNNETVIPIRSFSNEILPRLGKESFNVIYVDGGHEYSIVYKDLVDCGNLVKEGGLLCGDDLELQYHQIEDKDLLNQNKYKEFIKCEKTGAEYHPGVTIAVKDYFDGEVSNFNGFWAMRKKNAAWVQVDIAG
tara:strand:- start:945 stop:1403 length:459 start_codon:yes stop_codon:yes gene_type:complete